MEPREGHITQAETVKAVALEILNDLFQDPDALRRVALEQLRWLTFEDVMYVTGFEERKLSDLVKRRTIPMFKAPGSNQWRITVQAWQKCEAELVRQGLLPKNVYKHTKKAV